MTLIFTLLVTFELKHFLGDYVFQTNWMDKGKSAKLGWILPLSSHSTVHALLTLIILLIFATELWFLALVDFILHFIIDRLKASPNLGGKFLSSNPVYWYMIGLDQALHRATHFLIIYLMVV